MNGISGGNPNAPNGGVATGGNAGETSLPAHPQQNARQPCARDGLAANPMPALLLCTARDLKLYCPLRSRAQNV